MLFRFNKAIVLWERKKLWKSKSVWIANSLHKNISVMKIPQNHRHDVVIVLYKLNILNMLLFKYKYTTYIYSCNFIFGKCFNAGMGVGIVTVNKQCYHTIVNEFKSLWVVLASDLMPSYTNLYSFNAVEFSYK